ncbi:DUF397 domain-containing protein [Streptomyces sp. NBC_01237]|uniref:DUF397 domain-containing protein n=1 Tax=Streptomyces sp. NBC_01237 TaxID=2903790 RepID=UPI002DD8C7F5|nr:DUF397 domain-containing protein [Streptomyces sp. NBC_01237]WRZ77273.1 DUF397 domain-containing protein [Streptomyces sp. NBC_01237]
MNSDSNVLPQQSGWYKSSYSDGTGNSCVEVQIGQEVGVRDSKDISIPALYVSGDAWTAFTANVSA